MMKPLLWYKELADGRKRREHGFFLIEGRRAIEQIRTAAPESVEEVLVTDTLSDEFRNYFCPVRVLTERQFKTVCTSKSPQGIAAVVRIPEGSYENGLPEQIGRRLLLLEGVQDAGNVGTCIRTAAAFDFDGVIMSEECADAFSPKAIQASAGSIMSVWVRRTGHYGDLVKKLKNSNFLLIAADCRGEPLAPDHSIPAPCLIMLGSEGAGLSAGLLALADRKIRIPVNGRKAESLNVAAAGAILMFPLSGALPDSEGTGRQLLP